MTPGLKYTLARFGVFIVCTLPAVLFLPKSLDLLPRILIGFVLSAIVSFTLLRRWPSRSPTGWNTAASRRRSCARRWPATTRATRRPTTDRLMAPRRSCGTVHWIASQRSRCDSDAVPQL